MFVTNIFFLLFQPCFDLFYSHVKKLFSSDATLTHMEKCSLMEALVLISNQFKDFAKQKAFLDELMASVVADWTSDEMRQCVRFLSISVTSYMTCFSVMADN